MPTLSDINYITIDPDPAGLITETGDSTDDTWRYNPNYYKTNIDPNIYPYPQTSYTFPEPENLQTQVERILKKLEEESLSDIEIGILKTLLEKISKYLTDKGPKLLDVEL
jgi:hypothetical protein